MKEFTGPTNVPLDWVAPPGVTHVMVEMWGGGAGGGAPLDLPGGGGGAYSRSVITVIPGTTYKIQVGGGGNAEASPKAAVAEIDR